MDDRIRFYFDQGLTQTEIALSVSDWLTHKCTTLEKEAVGSATVVEDNIATLNV